MGDSIEITTWPKHQNIFYKVTSSAFLFEAKAPGNAAIGLARKPGPSCDFWVVIGDNRRSWIKKEDDRSKTVCTPNILTIEEYRRFWISWNGGYIKFGRDNEPSPIISYANKMPELHYITFTVIGERNPVHWKFELPPLMEKPKYKSVTGGEPQWVQADVQLPDGALIGGYEKETLYVIRANHRGSLTPGKFVPSQGMGYISWGGESNEKSEFEVLCGYDCIWVPSWDDRIPVGAIVAGYSENRQERLYVGRALHNGHLIPGKVQPSHKVCYIPFEDREIAKKRYEILVAPEYNFRCANKLYISELQLDTESESDQDDESQHEDWPNFRDHDDNVENNDDVQSNYSDY